jgi:hypothetical protein
MFAVITDPDFGISGSVLDKNINKERYALRQIQRATEEAVDPWLRKLNDQFAVIANVGGKCKVIEECMDHSLNRIKLTFQAFQDFKNRHMHQVIEYGVTSKGIPKTISVGQWWLQHPQRRQFETIVFAPGKDIKGAYNMWKGFSVPPTPGNNHSDYLDHIFQNICKENEEHYDYLIGWMARAVQTPDSPGQTAVVLLGRQGTGKSFFVNTFGSLFGKHYMQVSDPKHLVGSFNAHLRDCVVLFGDEAFYAGDKKHESVLKTLITEDLITIESKGVDAEVSPNCTHVLLASNNSWVVPAGADERRFFVLDVGDSVMQKSQYFKDIAKKLKKENGLSHLLHYLLHYDLKGFDVRNMPKTEALREQKIFSLNPDEEWWFSRLQEGRLLSTQSHWAKHVSKDGLYNDYIELQKKIGMTRRCSPSVMGRFLTKLCGKLSTTQFWVDTMGEDGKVRKIRQYFYNMPSLEECRQRWDDLYHTDIEWPIIVEGEEESAF